MYDVADKVCFYAMRDHMAQTVFKRYEKKYFMTKEQEALFLEKIKGRMELDKYGETTICNIYFDTVDYDLIRRSIEGPIYKEKLRLRSYNVPKGPQSKVFVEIKKKFDGVVYKRREELTLAEAEDYLYRGIHPEKDTQILREIDWFLKTNDVFPAVYLAYDRRAFAGVEDPEFRLTLDRNIRCRRKQMNLADGAVGEPIIDENTVLMEIKIPGTMPKWMSEILGELKIYPTSFSKYGSYYTGNPEVYMSVVENHKEFFDPDNDVVSIDMLRTRRNLKNRKKGV